MRALVFLLILANLLFLAWTHGYFGSASDPDAFRVEQQLRADQVRVVARDEPPADAPTPEKTAKTEDKPVAELCLQLADLPLAESVRVENLLADKWPQFKVKRTSIDAGASYWVFIPPLASKQEVDNKAAELKKLRVPELFIVQENGPNNRAISLGLFSTREAATTRLEMLRNLGVRSAKVGERRPASVLLEIRGPETLADTLRKTLLDALPEGRLAACKKPAAS